MRILYYFPELPIPMYQWQRIHFFDELARYNIEFDVHNLLMYDSVEEACSALVHKAKEGSYDLFFTNVCSEKHILIETVEELKRIGIPTLSFRSDNLSIPFNDSILAKHFDLVWLTAKETKYLYDKWGVNTMFAPYAANPHKFRLVDPTNIERSVCFIGTPYGSRTRMMNNLLSNDINLTLFYGKPDKKNTERCDVSDQIRQRLYSPNKLEALINRMKFKEGRRLMYGTVVNKLSGRRDLVENEHLFREKSVDWDDICSIYSRYALSLASTSAVHTDILKNPVKVINLRNFEIPMSGGIEICRYNAELADYFEDGKEILLYKDNAELIDKAKYYTERASDKELLSIKQAARRRSENEHTWMNRFKVAFDKLGLKY